MVGGMEAPLQEVLFHRMEAIPGASIYALLDLNCPVSEYHDLHIERLSQRELAPELTLIRRRDFENNPRICPRLLTLREPHDRGYPDPRWVDLTWECAQARRTSINGAYVCGWLVSAASPQIIAQQLIRNTVIPGPRRVVPLFEPYRLRLAAHYGGADWTEHWLGRVAYWLYVDSAGQLGELRRTAPEGASRNDRLPKPPPAFWPAQARLPRARQVLLALVKAGHAIPTDAELKIDQALQRAEAQGMTTAEDLTLFALNQLTLAEGWYAHPAAHDCLDAARRGERRLADGLRALSEATQEEIAQYAEPH